MSNCGLEIVLRHYVSSALLPTESLRKKSNGRAWFFIETPALQSPFQRQDLWSLYIFKLRKVPLKQVWILCSCVLQVDPEGGGGSRTVWQPIPALGGCDFPAEAVAARSGHRQPQSCCPRGLVLKSLVRPLPEPLQRNPETWRQTGRKWQMDRSPRKLMLPSPMTSLKPW